MPTTIGTDVGWSPCAPGLQAKGLASYLSMGVVLFLSISGDALSLLDLLGAAPTFWCGAALSAVGFATASSFTSADKAHVEKVSNTDRLI